MSSDEPEEEVVVFAEPPPADLKCSICLELFTDPLITACGHTFCSRCVFEIQSASAQCAVCREPLEMDELSPNLLAKSLVGEQRVHCRYGCTWTDEVGWVVDGDGCEEILQLGTRETHEVDCEYQPVLCPVAPDLCEVMYKWELEEHLEHECPYARPDAIKEAQKDERRRCAANPADHHTLRALFSLALFSVAFLRLISWCRIWRDLQAEDGPIFALHVPDGTYSTSTDCHWHKLIRTRLALVETTGIKPWWICLSFILKVSSE